MCILQCPSVAVALSIAQLTGIEYAGKELTLSHVQEAVSVTQHPANLTKNNKVPTSKIEIFNVPPKFSKVS